MTKKQKYAAGIALGIGAFFWFMRKSSGAVMGGDVIVSNRVAGGVVNTEGCPPGFRMRPARGSAPAQCVPR